MPITKHVFTTEGFPIGKFTGFNLSRWPELSALCIGVEMAVRAFPPNQWGSVTGRTICMNEDAAFVEDEVPSLKVII
jgi:hypothetical protein